MAQKKNNRWLSIILLFCSLAIWGIILFQIIRGIGYEPDISLELAKDNDYSLSETIPEGYMTSLFSAPLKIRNPFYLPEQKSAKNRSRDGGSKAQKTSPQKTNKSMPNIGYSGFISDPDGNLALLILPGDETVIGKTGDNFNDIKLVKISNEFIEILFENKKYKIMLNQ
jgi:hypothetical protein